MGKKTTIKLARSISLTVENAFQLQGVSCADSKEDVMFEVFVDGSAAPKG